MPTRQDGVENRDKGYSAILLGCVRLGNVDLDFEIRISDLQSNAKSENGFQNAEIMLRGISFWIFIFTVRSGNPKKDFKNTARKVKFTVLYLWPVSRKPR